MLGNGSIGPVTGYLPTAFGKQRESFCPSWLGLVPRDTAAQWVFRVGLLSSVKLVWRTFSQT